MFIFPVASSAGPTGPNPERGTSRSTGGTFFRNAITAPRSSWLRCVNTSLGITISDRPSHLTPRRIARM